MSCLSTDHSNHKMLGAFGWRWDPGTLWLALIEAFSRNLLASSQRCTGKGTWLAQAEEDCQSSTLTRLLLWGMAIVEVSSSGLRSSC